MKFYTCSNGIKTPLASITDMIIFTKKLARGNVPTPAMWSQHSHSCQQVRRLTGNQYELHSSETLQQTQEW